MCETSWRLLILSILAAISIVVGAGCKRADPEPEAMLTSKTPGYTNWCLAWSSNSIVGSYHFAGRKNLKWDKPAVAALNEYAYLRVYGRMAPGHSLTSISEPLQEAINAGCDDPLVQYVNMRILGTSPDQANAMVAAKYTAIAEGMFNANYALYLKFFAKIRAAQAWRSAQGYTSALTAPLFLDAKGCLYGAFNAEGLPAMFASEAILDLYNFFSRDHRYTRELFQELEPIMAERWPTEAFPHLIKGMFHIDDAWDARGGGFANTVTEENYKLFKKRLDLAESELNQAWKLDPRIPSTPLQFLRLELAQGQGRVRMEQWFERAIAFPENQYEAVRTKVFYLEPRWYGSEEECLAAARDISRSTNLTFNCITHIVSVHESLAKYYGDSRPNYWKNPQVWPDIQSAFTRYLTNCPNDNSARQWLIRMARDCEQWKVIETEIPRLTEIDLDYFGGEAKFGEMQKEAHRRATAK